MNFPVNLKADKEDGGFVVTFPDIPEAITQGDSIEEALAMALEALETALEFKETPRVRSFVMTPLLPLSSKLLQTKARSKGQVSHFAR